MKTPVPELRPEEKKRLARLFRHTLPKSYSFDAAYRRTVSDLTLFKQLQPEQRYPTDSAEGFLRWIGGSDIALHFQLMESESVCKLAHLAAKAAQARKAGSLAKKERNGTNGQFTSASRFA